MNWDVSVSATPVAAETKSTLAKIRPEATARISQYFFCSGIPAGQATGTLQRDNTLTGPIYFYNRSDATIEQGTTTIRLQY